jgi:hypothetical protein
LTEQRVRVERFREELGEDGPPPTQRSIGEILQSLRPQLQELAGKQAELARVELVPVAKQAGIAVGLLVTGAVFLLMFLGFFFATGAAIMIALGFPAWVAIGTMTVILLLIGGILAGIGAGRLRSLDPAPRRSIMAARQNVEWLRGQLKR